MSEKNIVKIIEDAGYEMDRDRPQKLILFESKIDTVKEYRELNFRNGYTKNVGGDLKGYLYFSCRTKDFKSIDIAARIGFLNEALERIHSPDEAIKAFEWLKHADEYLKGAKYSGTFNRTINLSNGAQSYMYYTNTAFMEEFQKVLLDFRNAYMGDYNSMTNNHSKKYIVSPE